MKRLFIMLCIFAFTVPVIAIHSNGKNKDVTENGMNYKKKNKSMKNAIFS